MERPPGRKMHREHDSDESSTISSDTQLNEYQPLNSSIINNVTKRESMVWSNMVYSSETRVIANTIMCTTTTSILFHSELESTSNLADLFKSDGDKKKAAANLNNPHSIKNRNTYRNQLKLLGEITNPIQLIPEVTVKEKTVSTKPKLSASTKAKKSDELNPNKTTITVAAPSSHGNLSMIQKLKVAETRFKMGIKFKKQRDVFYADFEKLKIERANLQQSAVVKIQSRFRGYTSRTKNFNIYLKADFFQRKFNKNTDLYSDSAYSSVFEKKPIVKDKIHEDLCTYSRLLGLKPIRGLTLESKQHTHSKYKKLAKLSGHRILRFLRMIVAKRKAKEIVKSLIYEKQQNAARVIQRFAKLVMMKNLNHAMHLQRNVQSAVLIQAHMRGYVCRALLWQMRRDEAEKRKQNDCAVIIQQRLRGALIRKRQARGEDYKPFKAGKGAEPFNHKTPSEQDKIHKEEPMEWIRDANVTPMSFQDPNNDPDNLTMDQQEEKLLWELEQAQKSLQNARAHKGDLKTRIDLGITVVS